LETRSENARHPLALWAWTFDGGRRTFIDIETSEQRPFQGAENQRPRPPVKKTSSTAASSRGRASHPDPQRDRVKRMIGQGVREPSEIRALPPAGVCRNRLDAG